MIYEIPLKIKNTDDGGCHLFIQASFGNQQKGWMIIDTGANKTVFDKMLISDYLELKEEINEEISSGINASIESSQKAEIKEFSIGQLRIKNYETIAISLQYLNSVYSKISKKKIVGLLGGDFLMKYQCKIDYSNQVLTILEE